MRTTINREKARELGFPIPAGASALIEYEIRPAGTSSTAQETLAWPVLCWHCKQEISKQDATAHTLVCKAHPLRKEIELIQAKLDSERASRKQIEQELEAALAKLTEPPTKPEKPIDPRPEDKPKPQQGRKAHG